MYISTEKKPGQTEQTAVKSPKMKWLPSMFLYAPFVVSRGENDWAAPPWSEWYPGQHTRSPDPGKPWLSVGLGNHGLESLKTWVQFHLCHTLGAQVRVSDSTSQIFPCVKWGW